MLKGSLGKVISRSVKGEGRGMIRSAVGAIMIRVKEGKVVVFPEASVEETDTV
jgi:hypothetical protein